MKATIRETHTRSLAASSTFGVLALLTTLVLAMGLAGNNSTAQAQPPVSPATGGSKATQPNPPNPPGQEKIAYVSTRDGNTDIYTMNTDGSNVTRLTTDPAGDIYPSWSPDGTKITFESCRVNPCQIF